MKSLTIILAVCSFIHIKGTVAELCSFDTRGQFYCERCCESECCEQDYINRVKYVILGVPLMLAMVLSVICLGIHACTGRIAEAAYARGVKDNFVLNRHKIDSDSGYFHEIALV